MPLHKPKKYTHTLDTKPWWKTLVLQRATQRPSPNFYGKRSIQIYKVTRMEVDPYQVSSALVSVAIADQLRDRDGSNSHSSLKMQ